MLSIPAVAQIEGITIFRDDDVPSRFYYLPRTISIQRAPDGSPMFTFLRYQFPIEREGEEKGGGYLVLTTAMTEDPDVLRTRVEPALSQLVRSELPPSAPLPEITLAPVDFTNGQVRLLMMRDDEFVGDVQLGRPSLFADNTASIAVELEELGASLFADALRQGGSVAAVEYDLTFPVRLPAVTIIGHVSSSEVKTAVMEYTRSKVVDGSTWGDDEREEAHRTSIAETMESQGLVSLEIRKGTVDLSEEDTESLRAFAFRAMDEFIDEHFLAGGSVETAADRESEWMEFLSQDIVATFDLNVSYRDVIDRAYNPSAQLNPSFLGAPIEDLVLDIDLGNAPWYYNNLEVMVDTNLDFGRYGDIVHSVVGHLTYDDRLPDGTRLTRRESVVFTGDDRDPKPFRTRTAGVGRDVYHVDLEVNYKSGPVLQTTLASFDTHTRNLTLNVPNPGVLEVVFATDPTAFDGGLSAVEVEVEYGDPRKGVPRAVETVILSDGITEATYRRVIHAKWDQPYRYRFTYSVVAPDGSTQRSTTAWVEASSATRHVRVPTPFDTDFSVMVIPQVDWREVRELIVDLDYHDEVNDYRVHRTLSFSEAAASAQPWRFPLRDPDQRSYRYAQKLLLHNNAVVESDWVVRGSDTGTLLVGNAPGGVATVEVDAADADLGGEVRRVVARLRYEDPANDVVDTATLLFRDATPQEWSIALVDATSDRYAYDVEYFMADGSRRVLGTQEGRLGGLREFLFLPPAPAPEPDPTAPTPTPA